MVFFANLLNNSPQAARGKASERLGESLIAFQNLSSGSSILVTNFSVRPAILSRLQLVK